MATGIVRRVRQNHAIEHGTVAMLLGRGIRPPLGGYSTPGGFLIFAKASTEVVARAAYDALDRLRSGDRELAVSPHCGTNLVTGALLAALVSGLIMRRVRREEQRQSFAAAVVAILVATVAGRPLGNHLQRRYTTLGDVANIEIAGIKRLWSGPFQAYRVQTRLADGNGNA